MNQVNEIEIKDEPIESTELKPDQHVIETYENFIMVFLPENVKMSDEKDLLIKCSKCQCLLQAGITEEPMSKAFQVFCSKCFLTLKKKQLPASPCIPGTKFQTINSDITDLSPFRCHYCSQVFVDKGQFFHHARDHATRKWNPFLCGMCGKNFKESTKFKRHICARNVLTCVICSKLFESVQRLEKHQLSHTTNRCTYCRKSFDTIKELHDHVERHAKEYRFRCEKCKRFFRLRARFNTHIFECMRMRLSITSPTSGVPVFIGL